MKIAEKYSHLNGEEYLTVHHKKLYHEIIQVITEINADKFMTKISKEKTMQGRMLYSPIDLNKEFSKKFNEKSWEESRYQYYVTTNRKLMEELILLPYGETKRFFNQSWN